MKYHDINVGNFDRMINPLTSTPHLVFFNFRWPRISAGIGSSCANSLLAEVRSLFGSL